MSTEAKDSTTAPASPLPEGVGAESEDEPLQFRGKLGDGRYADVYRAFDTRLEREVAVKIIKPEGAGSTDALTQAKALARVKHPNVGVVHSVEDVRCPSSGEVVPGVVMELIEGRHLDEVVSEGNLDPSLGRSIGTGILDGLAAIHRAGLAHLDLHEENILVLGSLVKIIDIHYLSSLALISTIPREKRLRHDFNMLFGNLARILKACGRNPRPVNDLHDEEVFDLEEVRGAFLRALDDEGAPVAPTSIDPVTQLKECIFERTRRIELRDLLMGITEATGSRLRSDTFPNQGKYGPEVLLQLLGEYESASDDIVRLAGLLGHWSDEDRHYQETARILRRLSAAADEQRAGTCTLLALRWIPFLRVVFAAGVGAISAGNFDGLAALLHCRLARPHEKDWRVVDAVGEAVTNLLRYECFKVHPELGNKYTPLSEYLHSTLRPSMDELLQLGLEFDRIFDRFEILLALVHGENYLNSWGPVGRFGWKLRNRSSETSEWAALETEAKEKGEDWGPLRAGLFGGSMDRFLAARQGLWDNVLTKLGWH